MRTVCELLVSVDRCIVGVVATFFRRVWLHVDHDVSVAADGIARAIIVLIVQIAALRSTVSEVIFA